MSAELQVVLEGGAPWGFRLHGGKEFRSPLRVAKVEVGGKAYSAGVKVGDQVLQINGKNVENLYHTEALVAVKRAGERLSLLFTKRDFPYESAPSKRPEPLPVAEQETKTNPEMIQVQSFAPASTVPIKPASATSIPVGQAQHYDAAMELLSDEQIYSDDYPDHRSSEWSPDLINDLVRTPDPISISKDADFSVRGTDSSLENTYDSGYDLPRTGSLPRSLGKKIQKDANHKSRTLPRKKSQTTPTWYKEMYNEIHKTMAGQSHLTRLLTADAAKGAFRDYDGATSPRGDTSRRKQRPKSIHVDKFVFDDYDTQDPSSIINANDHLTAQERRDKRHSVHSTLYRDFHKGGQIPAAGLADSSEGSVNSRPFQPTHVRSRSQDDMLSGSSSGLPYQKVDRQQEGQKPHDPVKFEYNNPPDFLDLRRKAEAEGTLREERERELRMLQEARKKWLDEDEEMRKSNSKQLNSREKLEAEKRMKFHAEEQRRIHEEEIHRQQQEEERRRNYEMQILKEEERRRQEEAELASRQATDVAFIGRARALYSFQPQSPAEIGFKKGDIVNVLKQVDDNWYEGEINADIGILPVNYVEMIEEEPESVPDSALDDAPYAGMQIEEGLAKARYAFQAENDKELSFRKNEMITLLRKLDANWYEGEIEDRIGIFPVAYIEVLKHPEMIKKAIVPSKLEQMIKADPVVARNNSEHERPNERRQFSMVNGSSHPPVQEKVIVKDDQVPSGPLGSFAADDRTPSANTAIQERKGERHRAIFSYSSMNQDELDVKEGDVVLVLEKCDDGWFVGTSERSGMFGTFPGNYVVPV